VADEKTVYGPSKIREIAARLRDPRAVARAVPDAVVSLSLLVVELANYAEAQEATFKRVIGGAAGTIRSLEERIAALEGRKSAPAAEGAKPQAAPAPAADDPLDGDPVADEAAAIAYVMGGIPGNDDPPPREAAAEALGGKGKRK
jgi:hypothetical protein